MRSDESSPRISHYVILPLQNSGNLETFHGNYTQGLIGITGNQVEFAKLQVS